MTLIDTAIQASIILGALIAVLGLIVWHIPSLSMTTKSKSTTKLLINNFTKLAIYFIWLIGLSLAVMVFGFIADWFTFDTFLWETFELVLITSLGMLFIFLMVIASHGKGVGGKEQGDDIHEHLSLLAKHLIAQMTFILVVTLIFIIKFLILEE